MWLWLRIAKAVALVGFILPWVTVSCSGTEIIKASGFDMATGRIAMTNPMSGASEAVGNGSPNLWALIALIAVIAGLIVALLAKKGTTGKAPIAILTSVVAFACAAVAVLGISTDDITSQASSTDGGMGNVTASMITVQYKLGFWLTEIALLACVAIAVLIWKSKGSSSVEEEVSPATPADSSE